MPASNRDPEAPVLTATDADSIAAMEREQFEAWWADECGSIRYCERRDDGYYYEESSRRAWVVWQAARRSRGEGK